MKSKKKEGTHKENMKHETTVDDLVSTSFGAGPSYCNCENSDCIVGLCPCINSNTQCTSMCKCTCIRDVSMNSALPISRLSYQSVS